ncbi:MAG: Acetylornithine deacetylase/Succinyl-diaminopimelate desuccinylase and related deacylases [uncultured Sphingomonadaceae bacterium]|uniref:Acetylornithine deacetylase/Succinyl-diaminopimelate desuccinylase and related deacylases n=1 Tax=uncultured Sphingomonadaceae bacterium TaxID=169976 RepID=A0A6J4SUG3_9SPHN|nr:MAG: Acetylornithine deacetylase/Succinyl-diaminopimelate desuccinylase and related deacylases [uncultured Sphingomonadaceae bacterium]
MDPQFILERDTAERAAAAPMLGWTEAWAAVNSGSGNLAGLGEIAAMLADAFSALPGEVELLPPAPAERVDARGEVHAQEHGRNLRLRVRRQAPLQLLLTGHMDTVYGADHPFQATRWLGRGILNGPGVADMKGGLAIMLGALLAVEGSAARDRIGYEVVINSDEEVGSPGSAQLLAAAARGKAAALTYEPAALPDGTLAGARPGSGNFSLAVEGRSAHAGRDPGNGRNALLAAADLALRLERARAPGLSVNPARIDGGGPNNVVPDRAVLRVNLRPRSAEDQARAQAALDAAAAAVSAEREVRITTHGGFARPPRPLDARAEALFALVERASADLGRPLAHRATGGVCDGNNIAAAGVPVVDTMGARGGSIHSADEYLIADSLPERAALSAVTMLRLAEGA